MYFFPNLEPVRCSMLGSNCCFLSCIQIFQETGKVVWYSHLFKNFPQFVMIHIVKDLSIVSEVEVDIFWNSLDYSMIQQMLAIWSLVPLPFPNPACTSGSSQFTYCWNLSWRILSITLLAREISAIVWYTYADIGLEISAKIQLFHPLAEKSVAAKWIESCKIHIAGLKSVHWNM